MRAGKRAFAILLAAAALPGCGGSDDDATKTQPPSPVGGDQRAILETIDELQSASQRGDGRKICNELFTPQLARSVRKAAKRSCATEVRLRMFRSDASIAVQRGIQVTGSTGMAVIREENGNVSTLHMLKRAGTWEIDRVTPRGAS
jgi:hypothetical protein